MVFEIWLCMYMCMFIIENITILIVYLCSQEIVMLSYSISK